MIEGSGSGSRAGSGSGSIPVTNGSGRPKNAWIRIQNTVDADPDPPDPCFWASQIRIQIH